jgi:hypothetical protein
LDNKTLWARVCKTDPAHVKPITGKDYSGNSPKPYWIVERLTEEFGPCGLGWGYSIESERFERFGETDVLHVAKVRLWYVLDGKRGEVEQMGQTKASYVTIKGVFKVDEDAPKKSVTDALVKCASYLGFAGDIFSGRWDDSKYVAELRKEFADEQPKKRTGVAADVLATAPAMTPEELASLDELAFELHHMFGRDPEQGPRICFERIEKESLDDIQKIYLATKLPTAMRNQIKAYSHQYHASKQAPKKETA